MIMYDYVRLCMIMYDYVCLRVYVVVNYCFFYVLFVRGD